MTKYISFRVNSSLLSVVCSANARAEAAGAARIVRVPERGAKRLARAVQNAVRTEIEHGAFQSVNQTDNIKDRAQTLDIVGDRRLVRRACLCSQPFCTFCASVRAADHADIVTGGRTATRACIRILPALLAPDRQEQAERKPSLRVSGPERSGFPAAQYRLAAAGRRLSAPCTSSNALLLTRTARSAIGDGTGRNVIPNCTSPQRD